MAQSEEKVLAQFSKVRYNKQDGVLFLTSARVAWAPGEHQIKFQVNHPYTHIRAQRISAESSAKVQLQLQLHATAGGSLKFHFTGENARANRNKVKAMLQQLLAKFSLESNPELEAKNTALAKDPALFQLYKDLVSSGLISADEFWSNRLGGGSSREEGATTEQQESGLPSAFLGDVQATVDGCNAVKYNVTADVIQAIFKIYPLVKAKHAEQVPERMSESEFWMQFFQSQSFHNDSSSSSTLFKDCFSSQLQRPDSSNAQASSTRETGKVLAAFDTPIQDEGYSVHNELQTQPTTVPLLQRCNHHSNMVLQAIASPSDPPPSSAPSSNEPASSLQLEQTHLSHQQLVSSEPLKTLAQQLVLWSPRQAVDCVAAHSAVAYLVPGGSLMPSGGGATGLAGSSSSSSSSLSAEQREELFRHHTAVSELLRHFWACLPTRTPQLEEKLHQMARCLTEYREGRLVELASVLGGTGGGAGGGGGGESSPTLQHLQSCISVALERYQAWLARKGKS